MISQEQSQDQKQHKDQNSTEQFSKGEQEEIIFSFRNYIKQENANDMIGKDDIVQTEADLLSPNMNIYNIIKFPLIKDKWIYDYTMYYTEKMNYKFSSKYINDFFEEVYKECSYFTKKSHITNLKKIIKVFLISTSIISMITCACYLYTIVIETKKQLLTCIVLYIFILMVSIMAFTLFIIYPIIYMTIIKPINKSYLTKITNIIEKFNKSLKNYGIRWELGKEGINMILLRINNLIHYQHQLSSNIFTIDNPNNIKPHDFLTANIINDLQYSSHIDDADIMHSRNDIQLQKQMQNNNNNNNQFHIFHNQVNPEFDYTVSITSMGYKTPELASVNTFKTLENQNLINSIKKNEAQDIEVTIEQEVLEQKIRINTRERGKGKG